MMIDRGAASRAHAERLEADIREAAGHAGVSGRICRGCASVCERCGETGCQCRCGPDCPDAPRALSSDPEAFPIEPAIVPLVFAMTRTGLFEPCWSCEGHLDAGGAYWKSPAIWFYSESTAQVRLLADGVSRLATSRRLSGPWRVAVAFSDPDNPRTAFSLEPELTADRPADLIELQRDARVLADALPGMLRNGGLDLQRAAGPALARARG